RHTAPARRTGARCRRTGRGRRPGRWFATVGDRRVGSRRSPRAAPGRGETWAHGGWILLGDLSPTFYVFSNAFYRAHVTAGNNPSETTGDQNLANDLHRGGGVAGGPARPRGSHPHPGRGGGDRDQPPPRGGR